MTWVRHYKKKKSAARPVIKRISRRKERIAKAKPVLEETGKAGKEEIPPEKYFMLNDGTAIKSIEELAFMMDSISDEMFSFHVNEEKNDFACWIRDVFGNKDLADSLSGLQCKKDNQIALLKHALKEKG